MNKKEFSNKLLLILEDRKLELPSLNWIAALYNKISKLSDEEINKGLSKIMSIPQKEWVKDYGFGGRPAIADWLLYFGGRKKLTPEQMAQSEIDNVLQKISGYYGGDTDFIKNQVTVEAVKIYTGKNDLSKGLQNLNWQIYDNDNPRRKELRWVAKELKEIWLNVYDNLGGLSCEGLEDSSESLKFIN